MNALLLIAAAALTSGLGAVGGLGGAILLVPGLVLAGMPVSQAAPLGLVSVAALSIAAGPRHLEQRLVNHRLGITTEAASTAGAVVGALLSGLVTDRFLEIVLASVAVAAALAGVNRKGLRNKPDPDLDRTSVGERVGNLGGAYPLTGDQIVPYRTQHVATGIGMMVVAGLIAGTAGASGGFIKTPATSEVMRVPMKVAAATTTFTIGVTAAAALAVFAAQGRVDGRTASAVIVGSLVGATAGTRLQTRMSPQAIRVGLSVLLLVVAVVLVIA